MQHFFKIMLTKGARFQHPHYWLPHQRTVKQTAADRGHGHKETRAADTMPPGEIDYLHHRRPPTCITYRE